jgi:hypothetical protein
MTLTFFSLKLICVLPGLMTSLIILPTQHFKAQKSFGCCLILACFLFSIHIFLNELKVLHFLDGTFEELATYPNGSFVIRTCFINNDKTALNFDSE